MCVGRYAAKVMRNARSEMEHNRSEMPAKVTKQICIPTGCDYAIKVQLMLSHSAGMQHPDISIAGMQKRCNGAKRNGIFSAYLPTHIKFLTEFHRIFFGTTCISLPNNLIKSPRLRTTQSRTLLCGCQLGGMPTGWDFLLFGEHDYFHVVASLEDYVLHEGCNLGWGEALDDALVVGFGVDTAAYVHVVNA